MVWRFSWCTLAALLLLLLLIAAEGTHGQSSQTDNRRSSNATSRGVSRFNARTVEQTTLDSSRNSQANKNQERTFQSRKVPHIKAADKTTSASNNLGSKSRLSRTTERNSAARQTQAETVSIEAGNNPRGRSSVRSAPYTARSELSTRRSGKDRRTVRTATARNETEQQDGPLLSVFTGAPDTTSLRTGRKIQTSFNSRDLHRQVPSSRRFENETSENVESTTVGRKRAEGRNAPGKRLEKNKTRSNRSRAHLKDIDNSLNRKAQDLFSASESIRVDIPFTTTTVPSLTTMPSPTEGVDTSRHTARVSNRRSDTKETLRANSKDTPTKNRGRGSDSESGSSNSKASRRGSSKFSESSAVETTERVVTPRSRNANARDRSRSEPRSRSRVSQDNGNVVGGQEGRRRSDRNFTERRSRIVDAKPKTVEQEPRRSRGRSRQEPSTTPSPAVVTTTSPASEAKVSSTVPLTTTEAEMMITTVHSVPTSTSATTTTTVKMNATSPTTTATNTRERGRGRGHGQGRAGKEDFFNHGLGFRGRKLPPEGSSTSVKESKRPHAHRNDTHHRGNPGWTLRRRPGHSSKPEVTSPASLPTRDQTNEIIPLSEQVTSTEIITKIETSTSTLRRGSKKPKTSEDAANSGDSSTKPPRRGNKMFDKLGNLKGVAESVESDNYPPEFKARLSQLTSSNSKLPAAKTAPRTQPEAKKSSAALFAERSRMKLELARRLVKPSLSLEENDLDTSTVTSAVVKSKPDEMSVNASKVDAQVAARESKKARGDGEQASTRSSAKKGRIISERMVTSISVEEGKRIDVEDTTKPFVPTTPAAITTSPEAATETTVESTRAKLFGPASAEKRLETSAAPLSRNSRYLERLSSTTPKPKKSNTRGGKLQSGERRDSLASEDRSTKKGKSKSTFRPRYSKRVKQKSLEDQNEIEYQATTTARPSTITSRYTRKKAEFKSSEERSRPTTTEAIERQTKRREFRPRTATYRRHSEIPTTLTEATTKPGVTGVAITPRSPRYHATLKSTVAPQSEAQEPQVVSLQVSNETAAVVQSQGITDSSNGNSGNTNIFSPTRSSLFLDGNSTLLERIRSTVAPLLNSLGNKSPIFAGAYSNVDNGNSAPRITPNGSPPRFSARYKGAELFVRKPSPYQPTVPSVTSSSTTPVTLLENTGAVPSIDVSSPGEPRFLTFYHALESASIKDEHSQVGPRGQPERVAQVDPNATSTTTTPNGSNGDPGNLNNDTTSPSTTSTTSSQTLSDTSVITNNRLDITTTLIPGASEDGTSASPPVTTEVPVDLGNTQETSSTSSSPESTTQSATTLNAQIDNRLGENESVNSQDTSTVSSTARQEFTSTVDSQFTVTTNAPTTMLMDLETEISGNDLDDGTPGTFGSTTQSVETTSMLSSGLFDSTTVATTSNPPAANSFGSPESNDIGESEGRTTEGTDAPVSSDAPTTETLSGSIADAPTTEAPITSTFRNRVIDFAQDILSRLQGAPDSTTVRAGFTTTVPPPTEISSALGDSRANTTLESLSQVRDVVATTTDATEFTTAQSSPMDLREMTTVSLSGNQLDARIDADDGIPNSVESTTMAGARDSGANFETTTVPTQFTTLGSDGASNDTLLRELMTIAKTLFSEAMNETQESLPVESTTESGADLAGNEVDAAPVTTENTLIRETTSLPPDTSAGQVDSTEGSVENSSENAGSSVENSSENVGSYIDTSSETTEDSAQDSVETSSEYAGGSLESSSENTGASLETSSEIIGGTTETSSAEAESENEVESNTASIKPTGNLSGEVATTVEPRLGEVNPELARSTESATIEVESPGATTPSATVLPVESEVESSEIPSTTTASEISDPDTTPTSLPTITTESRGVGATAPVLTTNSYDQESREPITVATTETQSTTSRQTTETTGDRTTELIPATEQTQPVNSVNDSTAMPVTPEVPTEAPPPFTSTNLPPEVTMSSVVTVPESILSPVNTSIPSSPSDEMTTEVSVNTAEESVAATTESIEESTVAATTAASAGVVAGVTSSTDTTTNQTGEPATEVAPDSSSSDVGPRKDSPPESATPPIITTPSPSVSTANANTAEAAETTDTNQPSLTIATEPPLDVVSNPAATTEATNTPDETTTTATSSIPQTTPNLENETPTVVARFQDATSATAQGTAGSAIGPTEQPTDISIPTTPQALFVPESLEPTTIAPSSESPLFEPSPQSSLGPITTTRPTTTTTQTTTVTGNLDERTSTTESSGTDVFTVIAVSANTPLQETTPASIDENLISTEASAAPTTTADASTSSGPAIGEVPMTTSTADNVNATTPASMPETSATMPTMMPMTTASPTMQPPTTPYLGRFGGTRITPAPRFSSSSTTKAPLRDYLIYGIYPNKTIVRKRPEDNLIDARNVDSPYVIFGIYPDGRLVRKFPNGTIIPDPPRSPVEVVFTLSTTTTTNRPLSRPYYNQANQGTYSQYQAPGYNSNPRPADDPMRNVPSPGNVDLGLTGNAIVGPNGGGPDSPGPLGSPASTGKMSDVLLNTRGGLSGNIASAIAGLLTPITSTGAPMRAATDSQGGRIVVDRERDEATRTREAGGQRSSVYIGQDKFVNYWTNASPDSNPRVLSVNINSVASSTNEGPSSASSSVPSFENLLNNESGGRVTAPPGFPWRDPLDQILGITTDSPVITASVASNTLDDSAGNRAAIAPRPVNPFVEVFPPISSTAPTPRFASSAPTDGPTTLQPVTASVTTTNMPTQSSSVAAEAGSQTDMLTDPSVEATTGAPSEQGMMDLSEKLLTSMQKQNAFGSTFDDLAFLNTLLQSQNIAGTTPKTLSEVEQLLANKILSLALNNPGPTRSSKAIQLSGASPNSFPEDKPRKMAASGPIVIDLFPSSTASSPNWRASVTEPASQNLVESTLAPARVTWKPVSSTATTKRETESSTIATNPTQAAATTRASTTRSPVVITSKPATTARPRTTTAAPFSFGAGLWQALFGGNFFGQGARPTKQNIKQANASPRPVQITPKPASTTQWPTRSPIVEATSEKVTTTTPSTTTAQTIDISKIQVITPNSILSGGKAVGSASSISTTQQPFLNHPNPRLNEVPATTTFSPEEDAKFLTALLRALQNGDTKGSASKSAPRLTADDELLLRAILAGQTTTTSTTPPSELSNAALLAALLKAQGIEPPMPAGQLREQLQLASLGQSVTSAPSGNPTTATTRPSSATARPTDSTTKKSATPRPTSRPRPRTTTWLPSSTYPPPLFSSFSNYGTRGQSSSGEPGNNALFGATRAFSQFLGAAISGAAQQLQSIVRNGTRIVTEAVG